MHLPRPLLSISIGALLAGSAASAVVIRHDVPEARFRATADAFPQLADMPGVGHGVLIAPQWVVTAAHAIQPDAAEIQIAGKSRAVAQVILHPGYRAMPHDMVQRARATNDAAEAVQHLRRNHDIALIQLTQPVMDVAPIAIYRGSSELGRTVQIFGKGATGTGLTGVAPGSPQRGTLRRAFNRISAVDAQWITYAFDHGSAAHRLEGMSGSGDSGGPVLIRDGKRWMLAGLTSWQDGNTDLRVPSSRYDQMTVSARLSYYASWIDGVLSQSAAATPRP